MTVDETNKAAATSARETASLMASLRKLETLKTRADAELAHAKKALAAAKTDKAKAHAEDLRLKAATKAAEAGTRLDTARADAKSSSTPTPAQRTPPRRPRRGRLTRQRRRARRSSRSSQSRSTSAARRRSST